MINLDFADVKTIMSGMGVAMMGTAMAEGPSRALEAAQRAISSPLLEDASVNGARGVIINVTGGPDLSLMEVNEALTVIQEAAHEDANIIFGAVVDPALQTRVKITVIATGFDHVRSTHSAGATAPLQTPVDMQSYTSQLPGRQAPSVPAAAVAMGGASARLTIARRPAIELSLPQSRPVMTGASTEPMTQGDADLDLNRELDVPAFLRRTEG
jgi:cell division protein FtsZ